MAVRDVQVHYERPYLYPKQEEAFFNDAKQVFIDASTKVGKTHGGIVWLTEQALNGEEHSKFWWASPVYAQSRIAFDRLKNALVDGTFTSNEARLEITLLNGAVIQFKSCEKPDNLYGEDVHALVIDEHSRVKEASWFALRTTIVATGAKFRAIGNVRGRRNWAYRQGQKSKHDNSGYRKYFKLTALDAVEANLFDSKEIAIAREDLPKEIFDELFMAEPADEGGNPFGEKEIELCVLPSSETHYTVPIAYGVDIAKSVDYTVITGIDQFGRVVESHRFQEANWKDTKDKIANIVGFSPCCIDATGVGAPIVEDLQREVGPNFESFIFTETSKQEIYNDLAYAIRNVEVGFPESYADELETFEYTHSARISRVKIQQMEGVHDDYADSLALGWKKFKALGGFSISIMEDIPDELDPDLLDAIAKANSQNSYNLHGPQMTGILGENF